MKRLIMALSIAALGLAFSGTAQALTTTGSMNISATMLPSCTVTTTPMAFGAYDGTTSLSVTSTITVNCSTGAPYRIDIDAGLTPPPGAILRRVKTGTAPADNTNAISYSLSKTTGVTQLGGDWGDNGLTSCTVCATVRTGKDAVGIGADEVHTVYGKLLTSTALAGSYTDTVVVTVNY